MQLNAWLTCILNTCGTSQMLRIYDIIFIKYILTLISIVNILLNTGDMKKDIKYKKNLIKS